MGGREGDKQPGWIHTILPAGGRWGLGFPEHQPLHLTDTLAAGRGEAGLVLLQEARRGSAAGGHQARLWGDPSDSRGYEGFIIPESRDFFFRVKNALSPPAARVL